MVALEKGHISCSAQYTQGGLLECAQQIQILCDTRYSCPKDKRAVLGSAAGQPLFLRLREK